MKNKYENRTTRFFFASKKSSWIANQVKKIKKKIMKLSIKFEQKKNKSLRNSSSPVNFFSFCGTV